MSVHLINVLYGPKGQIKVLDNNTAVVQEKDKPSFTIDAKDITKYIEKLGIDTSNNGAIHLGCWNCD